MSHWLHSLHWGEVPAWVASVRMAPGTASVTFRPRWQSLGNGYRYFVSWDLLPSRHADQRTIRPSRRRHGHHARNMPFELGFSGRKAGGGSPLDGPPQLVTIGDRTYWDT